MKKLLIIIFLIVANIAYSQYYDDLYYDSSYDGYSGGNEHLTNDTIEEDGTTSITNNYYLADYNDYYYTRRIRLRYFRYWRPYYYADWYYNSWCYPYYNYGWVYHSITYMNPHYSYYYPNYYYNNYNYITYYNKTYKNNNTYYGHRTNSSSNSGGNRTYTNINKGKKVVASSKPRANTTQKSTVKKTAINTRQTPKKIYTKTNYVSNGPAKTRSTNSPTANRTTTHHRSSTTNRAHSPKKTTTNRFTYSQNRYKPTVQSNNRNTRTFSKPTSRGSLSPKVGIRGR